MSKARWNVLAGILGRRDVPSAPPSLIVVGLGNPGPQYAKTRHNAGFWCIDHLAREHKVSLSRSHRSALVGEGIINGQRVVLAKPRTFVNRSGEAAIYLLARYRVSPQELLVICDDMNLEPGKVRLRQKGSAGGHNGIKSIVEALDTQEFPRLRVGIGQPPDGSDSVDYVLGAMSREEQDMADEAVARAAKAVEALLSEGMAAAMNRFN